MSFARPTQAPDQGEQFNGKCKAVGCNHRGTVSSGGDFMCFVHANADDWQAANSALRGFGHIVDAINELLSIGEIDWTGGKWQQFERRFANDPELKPSVAEREHRRWYEYRLRGHMLHLSGQGKKPAPREPLAPRKNRFGKAAI